jgi:dihydroorotase
VTNNSREGSDSAPHILEAKKGGKGAAAGCFTQGWVTQLVVGAVDEGIAKGWLQEQVSADILEEFLSGRGRRFYKLKEKTGNLRGRKILLEKKEAKIPETLRSEDGYIEVVPFKRGEAVWRLTWKP